MRKENITNNKNEDLIYCFNGTFEMVEVDEDIDTNKLANCNGTVVKFDVGSNITLEEYIKLSSSKLVGLIYSDKKGNCHSNINISKVVANIILDREDIQRRSVHIFNMDDAIVINECNKNALNEELWLMKSRLYNISEFASLLKVTVQTLRNWDKSGKLVPSYRSETNRRLYTFEQALQYLKETKEDKKGYGIGYILGGVQEEINKRSIQSYLEGKDFKDIKIVVEGDSDAIGLKDIIKLVTTGLVDELVLIDNQNIIPNDNLWLLELIFGECGCKIVRL